MAQTVLRDVEPVIDRIRPQGVERLAMFARTVELTAEVPSCERALEIADEARRFGTAYAREQEECSKGGTQHVWRAEFPRPFKHWCIDGLAWYSNIPERPSRESCSCQEACQADFHAPWLVPVEMETYVMGHD